MAIDVDAVPDPTKLREQETGRVEEDDFVINDVPLSIPPTAIHVEKQSMSYEWNTLRTRGQTQAKSGHGSIRVSIDVIFKNFVSLVKLVAGLRSTPFCVVSNKYLDGQLKNVQSNKSVPAYKELQPIVLALTSATFSTMGHEGIVDCISGHLEFIYFNYFPYTPIFAFKTGASNDSPGPIWRSQLWKEFCRPYENEATIPTGGWPVIDPTRNKTVLKFKEFLSIAVDDNSAKSTESLLGTAKGLAKDALSAISESFKNKTSVEAALAELKRRSQQGGSSNSLPPEWQRLTQHDINPKFALQQVQKRYGGAQLYVRNKQLTLSPERDLIVQQIVVSFTNFLAIIPMVGHTYPTCQYIGAADAEVMMTINAGNNAAHRLQKMYDDIEQSNLEFKQIPQGFRNVFIENDFLALFGPTEFIFNSVTCDTIPSQPGRSSLVVTFKQAGLTTKTSFDDPEDIKQEFVASDDILRRKVYGIISKYLRNEGGAKYRNQGPVWDQHKLERYNIVEDGRNNAFIAFVDKARDYYNDLLYQTLKRIFSNKTVRLDGVGNTASYFLDPGSGPTTVKNEKVRLDNIGNVGSTRNLKASYSQGAKSYKALFSFNAAYQVYVPEWDRLKAAAKQHLDLTSLNQQNVTRNQMNNSQGGAGGGQVNPLAIIDQIKLTPQEIENEVMQQMGMFSYLSKMRILLDEIIQRHLNLSQFAGLKKQKEDLGISKGSMAYPDFAPQLIAAAGWEQGTGKVSDAALIKYDPDYYMWYPAYNGALAPQEGQSIIDSRLTNIAKQQSLDVWKTAQGDVGKFFEESYINKLTMDFAKDAAGRKHKNPIEELKKNCGGKMTLPLYDNVTIQNASQQKEKIQHMVVPDPTLTHTNWYEKQGEQILSKEQLSHSTDVNSLWEGVDSKTSSGPDGFFDDETKVSGQGIPGTEKGMVQPVLTIGGTSQGVSGTTIDWSTKSHSSQMGSPGLLSPIKNSSGKNNDGCLKIREINKIGDQHNLINKALGSKFDYRENPGLFQSQGWTDIREVEKDLGPIPSNPNKPGRWTVANFRAWQRSHPGKKFGYQHKGIDVGATIGTEVYSVADGKIRHLQHQPQIGPGRWIWISHPDGKTTIYAHLDAIRPNLRIGSHVKAGELIGLSGGSGGSIVAKWPHLHFEIWAKYRGFRQEGNTLLNPNEVGIAWTRSGVASRWKPPAGSPQAQKIDKLAGRSLSKDVTSTMSSPLTEAIKEFELDVLSGQGQRLVRAYPTFKLYFIEDDSGERKRLAFDDFFSYNAVKSIRVIKSREIAADLCILELTNISGTLSNRKFRQEGYKDNSAVGERQVAPQAWNIARDQAGNVTKDSNAPMNANTRKENPIASLLLQEGIQISLRLGYASDPDLLDLVFTGHITNVEFSETDDLVQVIAQSFATELVQDIKGLEVPIEKETPWWEFWGFKDNASTGRILEEMLAQPEVLHFGRWKPRGSGTSNRDLLTDKWQFVPNPADDNIFAPSLDNEINIVGNGLIFRELKYTIFRTTIWDIFKEMELRHPNFIASPVPYKDKYGDRMTMFFGMPHQLYFARHPTADEESVQEKLKAEIVARELILAAANVRGAIEAGTGMSVTAKQLDNATSTIQSLTGLPAKAIMSRVNIRAPIVGNKLNASIKNVVIQPFVLQRLQEAKRAGYIRPFRRYHLVTSRHHIISNNIQTNSRDVANTIVVHYSEDTKKINPNAINPFVSSKENKAYVLKLDSAIPTEDMRTQYGQFVNVTNENLAKRYAVGMLMRNLKRAYKGDLIIIGNPRIKPYDVVYLHDEESEMVGPIEVRQITHTFTQDTGFVSEIVPDMLVSASDWSLVATNEAMGSIVSGIGRDIFGMTTGVQNAEVASINSTTNRMIGSSVSILSSLTGNYSVEKILNYTTAGQPIIFAPLTHHGRPFAGGIPTRKLPHSLWRTLFGKFYSDSDNNFSAWWEDTKDGWIHALKKISFQYSEGHLLRGWTSRSFEAE